MNRNSTFGNCVGCGQYRAMVLGKLCGECLRDEQELLDAAIFYTEAKPDATAQEIAEYLEIAESRVAHWALDGKLDCVFLEKDCEACGHHMVNQMTCPQCGETVEHDLEIEEQPNSLDQSSARIVFLQNRTRTSTHHR